MSRVIKFRGIATVNDKYNGIKVGDFVYGAFIETNIDCQILFGDGEQMSVDRKTVGQYTGLKDKNGVEIYEDDILIGSVVISKRHMLVKFADEIASFVIMDKIYGPVTINQEKIDSFELIASGNIHENPELISD